MSIAWMHVSKARERSPVVLRDQLPHHLGGSVSHQATLRHPATTMSWATWRCAFLLILAATILRLVYHIWLSPWELVGDEAYYWVQSFHLAAGYTEKGPLLPWMIAAACRLFGDVEWAVRLPVVLASALAAWGIGKTAMSVARGDERVGFLAVVIFLLLPAFQANAQICTQDGPLITVWVGLGAIGLRLFRRWREGSSTWIEWLMFGAVMGLGFLLKQSIFVFLPGMAIYWLFWRRELPLRPVLAAQMAAGVVTALMVSYPMLAWNAAHGWPMLAHTLGHLGAGGDQSGKVYAGNPLLWEANTIGSFIGAFGPGVILMVSSCVWAWRRRGEQGSAWRDQSWLMCSAWPATLFFVALSLTKPVVPSWPLPNMVPVVVLVAQLVACKTAEAGSVLSASQRRFRAIWRATVLFGLCSTTVLAFPNMLAGLPKYGEQFRAKVLSRLTGNRERFKRLERLIGTVTTGDSRPPLIVAPNYQMASLATFYMAGHPPVATRGNYAGHRPSNFDQWSETDLLDPRHRGRTLVLMLNGKDPCWEDVFRFDQMRESADPGYLIATDFGGVRRAALTGGKP